MVHFFYWTHGRNKTKIKKMKTNRMDFNKYCFIKLQKKMKGLKGERVNIFNHDIELVSFFSSTFLFLFFSPSLLLLLAQTKNYEFLSIVSRIYVQFYIFLQSKKKQQQNPSITPLCIYRMRVCSMYRVYVYVRVVCCSLPGSVYPIIYLITNLYFESNLYDHYK